MNKLYRLVTMVVLIVFTVSGLGAVAHAATSEQWGGFDIRTKPNSELTADKIDAMFAKNGKGGVLIGTGKTFMEVGEKNGINPGVLTGFAIVESGWGKSNRAKTTNNLFGIKCLPDFKCRGSFAEFDSVSQAIQIHAELLAGKRYFKQNLFTLKQILEVYAPPSDGNNLYGSGGYIDTIRSVMENHLGQTLGSGGTMTATGGEYSEGGEGNGTGTGNSKKVGTWQKYNFFIDSQAKYENTGLDTSQDVLPGEVSYGFEVFSEKTYRWLVKAGWVLSAVIIGYMATTVVVYLAIIRGVASNTNWFYKLTRIDGDVYGKMTLMKVAGAVCASTVAVFMFMTGFYVDVMGFLYLNLQRVVEFIF